MDFIFLSGFITGGGLIVAVGAQNAFLFEQALKRQYAKSLATLFILSDCVAITIGTLGFQHFVDPDGLLFTITKWAGVIFLIAFAFQKIRNSFDNDALIIKKVTQTRTLLPLISTGFMVTWLNPHFYLDTVFLMGNLANQWGEDRFIFALGGIVASIVWFYSLVTIGVAGSKWLEKPIFWRWFNRTNGLLIILIALQIARQ